MKMRPVFLALAAMMLSITACEREKAVPTAPVTDFNPALLEELFVVPGGTGTGAKDYPMGSVQNALELAYRHTNIRTIKLATGQFTESCRIRSGVTLMGGYDRLTWELTDSQTIIQGKRIDNLHLAISMRNLAHAVVLENLIIRSEAAIDSGAPSIAVYCLDMADVTFRNCILEAGSGKAGRSGQSGESGVAGAPGLKETPGESPTKGGPGGIGGPANLAAQQPGTDGGQGYCFDGSQSGGSAGSGGINTSGQQGGEGSPGMPGERGIGGGSELSLLSFDIYVLPKLENGSEGGSGGFGCGGGGGGGSASLWAPNYSYKGFNGGGGGSGGSPGTGGLGGQGGGSSVGMIVVNSTISVLRSTIKSGDAGSGGVGGSGGIGGVGGIGGTNTSFFGLNGGEGGRGGKGGDGGAGGGGAGGWSIGVLKINSGLSMSGSSTQTGSAGLGSGEGVAKGADGQSLAVVDWP